MAKKNNTPTLDITALEDKSFRCMQACSAISSITYLLEQLPDSAISGLTVSHLASLLDIVGGHADSIAHEIHEIFQDALPEEEPAGSVQ